MAGRWLRRGVALIVLVTLLATAWSMRAAQADDLAALVRQISKLETAGKYVEAVNAGVIGSQRAIGTGSH